MILCKKKRKRFLSAADGNRNPLRRRFLISILRKGLKLLNVHLEGEQLVF